jgi:hypothetical protein
MVKQTTHNRLSGGSIPSVGTSSGVSIMDNTADFYSANMGSIPVRRTSKYNSASMGELVDPVDLKSTAVCGPVRLRLLVPKKPQ